MAASSSISSSSSVAISSSAYSSSSALALPPLIIRSEERRVGKECRSLCDWSSDVCSSDLIINGGFFVDFLFFFSGDFFVGLLVILGAGVAAVDYKIGRASCRERV